MKQCLTSMTHEDLQAFMEFEVETRITSFLRGIPLADVPKDASASDAKAQVESFCACVEAHCKEASLVQRLHETAGLVRGLVQTESIETLSKAVATISEQVAKIAAANKEEKVDEEGQAAGPIANFFYRHQIGSAILAEGKRRVDASGKRLAHETELKELTAQLESIKKLEMLDTKALSEQVKPWWMKRNKLPDATQMVSSQALAVDLLAKEFWVCLTEKVSSTLKNQISGTLEYIFESLTSEAGSADSKEAHDFVDFNEALDSLVRKDMASHLFWKETQGAVPTELRMCLSSFKTLCDELLPCLQFCLGKAVAKEPGRFKMQTCVAMPTTDQLGYWCDGLPKDLKPFLDDADSLQKAFEAACGSVAKQQLRSLTLSSFELVGQIVQATLVGGIVGNAVAEAKMKLPMSGDCVDLVSAFFKACFFLFLARPLFLASLSYFANKQLFFVSFH